MSILNFSANILLVTGVYSHYSSKLETDLLQQGSQKFKTTRKLQILINEDGEKRIDAVRKVARFQLNTVAFILCSRTT